MKNNSGKNTGNANKKKNYEEVFLHLEINNMLQPSKTRQRTVQFPLRVR